MTNFNQNDGLQARETRDKFKRAVSVSLIKIFFDDTCHDFGKGAALNEERTETLASALRVRLDGAEMCEHYPISLLDALYQLGAEFCWLGQEEASGA